LWGNGWVWFDDPYLAFPVSRHAGPTLSVSLV
jgi:hypothetical protein